MSKSKDILDNVPDEAEVVKNTKRSQKNFEPPAKRHEIFGVLAIIVALFILLSLASYSRFGEGGQGKSNIVGIAGEWTAHIAFTLLGYSSYLLDIILWIFAISLFRSQAKFSGAQTLLGIFFVLVFSSIALHTSLKSGHSLTGGSAGGFLGELLGEFLISIVSTTGTYLIAFGGIVIVTLLITNISLTIMMRTTAQAFAHTGQGIASVSFRVVEAWKNYDIKKDTEKEDRDARAKHLKPIPEPEMQAALEDSEEIKTTPVTEPKIVTKKTNPTKNKQSSEKNTLKIDKTPIRGEFQLPSHDLLVEPPHSDTQDEIDEKYLKETADRLIKILADFGVTGEVREIHPGPVVTMFEFQPKSGTKLSKIESLSSEVAMALEVLKVRVVAPIPGKNAVGFELPNKTRETVYLREMLTDEGFLNKKSKLPLALGKDISGTPYFVDLAKMPHLLIAGTTGSGKSVSLNAMLLSLLYKYTPEDLRFLMVDPKMIELGAYDGIPHLLLPVVTDMSKACLALKWAVDEMERRYQLFADVGVRNLAAYNAKIEKLKKSDDEYVDEEGAEKTFSVENDEVVVVSEKADVPEKLEKLPFVCIVVDELADLMMVAAKDVETSIARLAQKARAAGLHLIVATQRPSVDVITGLIKANFPSRISFRVSSNHDSRTILGTNGAEDLLGMGDMLIMPPGTSDLTRVHGAFVNDDEIQDVVTFLKTQGAPEYDQQILMARDDEESGEIDESEKDEVYDQALAIVAEAQVCSISMLQRRLRIGYNRSARIVEIMEKEGVVGPANGVNKREVLISPH